MANTTNILTAIQSAESAGGGYLAKASTSSANGAYQYINSTWPTSAAKAGIDPNQYPTASSAPPVLQDQVAISDLNQKGLMTADPITFQYRVSQEWAGIPVPAGLALSNGQISDGSQSFYAGVGNNKATISSQDFQTALANTRAAGGVSPGDGIGTGPNQGSG